MIIYFLFTFLIHFSQSQINNLKNPDLVSFDLSPNSSASFHLSPTQQSTTTTYYVTLNICGLPTGFDNITSLDQVAVLYVFDNKDQIIQTGTASPLVNGFANVTVAHNTASDQGIWITVNAPPVPSADNDAVWAYQLGISTEAPMHVIDQYPYFQYSDSDNATALFTSPTYYPSIQENPSTFLIMLPTASGDAAQTNLIHSSCFLQTDSDQVRQSAISVSQTQRGVLARDAAQGGTVQQQAQAQAGGQRDQYLVDNLQTGTNYTVLAVQFTGQEVDGTQANQASRLYQPQYFQTKQSANCRLVTDFAACPSVAYSVPAPVQVPTAALLDMYNSLLTPHLVGFNTTLYTFPCGMKEQGNYSSVHTCDDCYESYRTWLCTMIMPQCTDIPDALQQQAQDNYTVNQNSQLVFSDQPIPDSIQTVLLRTNPALSRTPQLSPLALANNTALAAFDPTSPFPYGEVPPCAIVCQNVAASCPFLIGWNCPLKTETLAASYGIMQDLPRASWQGGNENVPSLYGRGTDRFGNRFCNTAGVDVLVGLQAGITSAAMPLALTWPTIFLAISLYILG